MEIIDNYRHKGLRKGLLLTLKQKGISDTHVLDAISKVPRHIFFENAFLEHAYEDKAFPIGNKQTISQPYTVAFQSSLLELKRGMKVLEIGTGSGYQSCILMEMGARLYSIEVIPDLHKKAVKMIEQLGYKGNFYLKDGTKGLATHAPYDRIIVTAGAPAIPETLIEQLKPNGIAIIPVGDQLTQKMLKITKAIDNNYLTETFGDFSFVPLKGEKGW